MSRRGACLLIALGAGAFFALASPPANLYLALWAGMAVLAFALGMEALPGRSSRLRLAFTGSARGLAFGFAANVVALRFVPDVIARFTTLPWAAGALALALLAAFEGTRWMLAAMVCEGAVRLRIPRWAAFPIGVYAGTFVPTVFPWSAAGGVTPWPVMIQLADILGERGVTALMALAAGLLAEGVRAASVRRRVVRLSLAAALPLATAAYGALRMKQIDARLAAAPHVTVGLVQPSIGATERWDAARAESIMSKLTILTRSAESRGARLTVWPESAYPYVVAHASRRAPIGNLAMLGDGVRGPVLTGLILQGGAHEEYNSAAITTADGALSEPQDKLHLLWFGETVPFADRSPWLRRTFARGTGLVPGGGVVLLRDPATGIRAGVLNCFEDTLPDAGLDVAQAEPNLLVNVTNDAWFAGSAESELHLRLATLRAVELRRDLVRAVNFGPTTWVDASGRVRARYADAIAGTLIAQPALLDGPPTLYARFGDRPYVTALLVFACVMVVQRRRAAG